MTSPRLGRLRESPELVALLPVGATEPHGPHAPLGTDTLISEGICRRVTERLDGRAVQLPSLPYGVTRFGSAFPGAIGISEATLEAVLSDLFAGLAEQGIRRVVVVNSHFEPAQVATLRRAVAGATTVTARLVDLTRSALARRLTDEFRRGSCHGGRYESSLMLADAPGLVDEERMRRLPALDVDMPAGMAAGATDFVALGMADAYCGAPAEATADEGEATFAVLTDIVVEVVEELAGR